MAKASKTLRAQAKRLGVPVTKKVGGKRKDRTKAELERSVKAAKKRTTVRTGSSRPRVKVKGYGVKGHTRKARKFG